MGSLITWCRNDSPSPLRFTTFHYFPAIKQLEVRNTKNSKKNTWPVLSFGFCPTSIDIHFKKFLNFPFQIMNSLSVEIATQNFKLNQNSIYTFLLSQLYSAGFAIQETHCCRQYFDFLFVSSNEYFLIIKDNVKFVLPFAFANTSTHLWNTFVKY